MTGTTRKGPAMSAAQRAYFERLEADAERAYELARQARAKGLDPTREVNLAVQLWTPDGQIGERTVSVRAKTSSGVAGASHLDPGRAGPGSPRGRPRLLLDEAGTGPGRDGREIVKVRTKVPIQRRRPQVNATVAVVLTGHHLRRMGNAPG